MPQTTRPPPASQPKAVPGLAKRRAELRAYLQKNAGVRPEKPAVPQGKPADYWNCLQQYDAAKGDKKRLFALIAEHLRLAEALLEQESPDVKQSAMGVFLLAARCADERLHDHALAAELCDVWLLPNLELAHPVPWKHLSKQTFIEQAAHVHWRAKHYEQVVEIARLWIKSAPNQNVEDAGRLKLARALDELGRTAEAIAVLKEIKDKSLQADKDLIPALAAKLAKEETEKSPPVAIPMPASVKPASKKK